MAETQKVWSPAKTNVNWGGTFTFKGFAEGTFITSSRNTDNTRQVVGAHGDVALTLNADRTGTVTVTLLQTSETNRILASIQAAQDETGELYRADLTISDQSGSNLVDAQACHIMTTPENALSDDQTSKTWVFYSEKLTYLPVPTGYIKTVSEEARANNSLSAIRTASEALKNLA